ncbi:MAG: hypothetical protein OER85_01875 [Gammaproteobacteria bacterium]|nr:hypothetical protein [Gammaproteobacteria bacterium]
MQFKQHAVAEFIRQQRFVWQFVTIPAVGRVLRGFFAFTILKWFVRREFFASPAVWGVFRGFVLFSILNWVSGPNRRPAAWRTDAYSR